MSRYDLTPDDLLVLRDNSPLAKFYATGQPLAYMRGPHAHGNDVMRVAKHQRPHGWMMHEVSECSSRKAPGEVPLVPECTGEDNIPDWAIAKVVRQMAASGAADASHVLDLARELLAAMTGSRFSSPDDAIARVQGGAA